MNQNLLDLLPNDIVSYIVLNSKKLQYVNQVRLLCKKTYDIVDKLDFRVNRNKFLLSDQIPHLLTIRSNKISNFMKYNILQNFDVKLILVYNNMSKSLYYNMLSLFYSIYVEAAEDDIIIDMTIFNVYELVYFAKNISDLSSMDNIRILRSLYNESEIKFPPNLKKLYIKNAINLSTIVIPKTVSDAVFDNCYYYNIICPPHISLILYKCNNITTVNNFTNVKKLYINDCKNLSDISKLENIESLTLIKLPKIKCVDNLHSVKNLTIGRCYRVKNINRLMSNYCMTLYMNKINRTTLSKLYKGPSKCQYGTKFKI